MLKVSQLWSIGQGCSQDKQEAESMYRYIPEDSQGLSVGAQ